MVMRTVLVGLVALAFVIFGVPQAHAEIVTVHDTLGLPDPDPIWVDGGKPMSIRFNEAPGGGYTAAGVPITVLQPTMIHTINGVMANSGSSAWTSPLHINVHSSKDQFGASALMGDVYHDDEAFFANLSGGSPPAWGGNDASGKINHWVELGFEPFVLEPGDYVISVQAYLLGSLLSWTETLNDFGVLSDVGTSSDIAPEWGEWIDQTGYTTGNAAVVIQGTVIPTPGVLPCLMAGGFLLSNRRRRKVCAANTR